MDYVKDMRQFHNKFGHVANDFPTLIDSKTKLLRIKLMVSELSELLEAMVDNDLVEIADGLGDLLYVVFGTAVSYGIPIDLVFKTIHENNLTKFHNGKAVKDSSGKVVKPPNYESVDLSWIKSYRQKGSSDVTKEKF